MKQVARLKWIASFDMENLIGVILQDGMLISMGLVLVGLGLEWVTRGQSSFQNPLHGENILSFVQADFYQAVTQKTFPALLTHLGIAVLILTPYVRLLASFFYFASVERDLKYTFLTALVLVPLTYLLLLG